MLNHSEISSLKEKLAAYESLPQGESTKIANVQLNLGGECREELIFEEESGIPSFRTPYRIFGEPFDAKCLDGVRTTRDFHPTRKYIKVSNESRIISWRAFIDSNSYLHAIDAAPDKDTMSSFRLSARPEYEGFLVSGSVDSPVAYFSSRNSPNRHEGNTLFIPFIEQANYGSFLFRGLPAILFASDQKLPFDRLVVPERTPWVMSILMHTGLGTLPVFSIREICGDYFANLYTVVSQDNEGMLDFSTLGRLDRLKTGLDLNYAVSKRIYVSRQLSSLARPNYRVLLNEKDVQSLAQSMNFSVVYPETLSFEAQVSVFHNAEVILGPSGSGMLNSIFSKVGASVIDIESFHGTVRQHAKLYSSSGKQYGFVFGSLEENSRPPALRSWKVSLNLLKQAIESVRSALHIA